MAKVRTIISRHFDDSLGDDDIGRHFCDLKFWKPDQPLNKTDRGAETLEIFRGIIQQVTCKRDELLVVLTNPQDEFLLIIFHSPIAFKGISVIGTEICDIYQENDVSFSQNVKRIAPIQNKKSYHFKTINHRENTFTIIAGGYSIDKI